ncbi:His-Xaa-Ser system radical SAM maturase HxsB [Roseateles sp. DAIF2]|uniref:His-Xaa-Ser system radical SAM maturase HxsB n=1 Tax=Roseateles sp. DAIF2 TaxID=2714952 RepID=UPI0018A30BD6|nr:His-Xaa-Ser system radical SAM maturase HxsB [Roseateles sp. DAIF2]QPF75869.1 His-Xaa-Ser system radical SAM maturase HxsB [Roseateles sp. DAIF2]
MDSRYAPVTEPFSHRALRDGTVAAISQSGDHVFLSAHELALLRERPSALPLNLQAALKARFFLKDPRAQGMRTLLRSRIAAKRETVTVGPSLHILVPTLQCAHSCRYCQVSRALSSAGFSMTEADIDRACDTILQSPAPVLTVEFQGGDPLIRFDLIQRAVLRLVGSPDLNGRRLRFVIASTLHQLDEAMCDFMKSHGILLSTSLDGPESLHDRNRPTPSRDAYRKTMAGVALARRRLGEDAVSALMTTTKASLEQPEAIVDEYVQRGFRDLFIRPLSSYGFAKRNPTRLAYSQDEFREFYGRALDRVLHWNRQGVALREVYASIILNKLLSPFDAGYVDLQSPTGAGSSVLVYNYDGYVYPSDEARMLVETGDRSLRIGRIGTSLSDLQKSPVLEALRQASLVDSIAECSRCAYRLFCAPNPVDAQAQFGNLNAPVAATEHCQRHLWLFDLFLQYLHDADAWQLDLFHAWAAPVGIEA